MLLLNGTFSPVKDEYETRSDCSCRWFAWQKLERDTLRHLRRFDAAEWHLGRAYSNLKGQSMKESANLFDDMVVASNSVLRYVWSLRSWPFWETPRAVLTYAQSHSTKRSIRSMYERSNRDMLPLLDPIRPLHTGTGPRLLAVPHSGVVANLQFL